MVAVSIFSKNGCISAAGNLTVSIRADHSICFRGPRGLFTLGDMWARRYGQRRWVEAKVKRNVTTSLLQEDNERWRVERTVLVDFKNAVTAQAGFYRPAVRLGGCSCRVQILTMVDNTYVLLSCKCSDCWKTKQKSFTDTSHSNLFFSPKALICHSSK